jgi:hypothetical protein
LTRRDPKNPVFHVRLGHAYRDLKFEKPALTAYLKARELAPEELGIRFVIADYYTARERWKEALRELDQAAAIAAERAEKDWEPALRRVGVQLARKSTFLVKREVAWLLATAPADEEVRRHLSDRLSSMAARAFALQRPQDGNYLLEVARSLRPERQLGSFPEKLTVPLDQLPEETQRWLKDQPARHDVKPLWSRGYLEAGALMALALVPLSLGLVAVDASISATRSWGAGLWVGTASLLASGAWAIASGAYRIVRARRSALGKFTALHQHYLVQADLDQVTFWPLINLVKVAVYAHQYGAGFGVRLKFGRRSVGLNISGKQVAESLAEGAAQLRGRALDLLSSGLLEADGEVDLVPRALLSGQGRKVAWSRRLRGLRWPAAGAGAAALSVLALPPLQARAQDDQEWERAQYTAPQAAYYLEAHPDGRHVAEARAKLDHELERGLHRLQQMHQAQSAVLGEVIEALRRAGTNRVQVVYSPSVKLGGFRAPTSFAMAQVALADAENLARHARITAILQKRIDALAGPGVVELRDGIDNAQPPSPVRLEIRSVLGLSGEVYELEEDPASRYFGLALHSSVDLKLGDGASVPAHHYDVEARPAGEVHWSGASFAPRYAYWQMANAAADVLGERLAVAMQLGE